MKFIKNSLNNIENAMVQISTYPFNTTVLIFLFMLSQLGLVSGKLKVIYIIQLFLMLDKVGVELSIRDLKKGVKFATSKKFVPPIFSFIYLGFSIYIWTVYDIKILLVFCIEQLLWTILVYFTHSHLRCKLVLIEKAKIDKENEKAVG